MPRPFLALVLVLLSPIVAESLAQPHDLETPGPGSVLARIEALPDDYLRRRFAFRREFRANDPASLPVLIAALKYEETHDLAAQALGDLGAAAEPAVPALIESLAYDDFEGHAATALGRIGAKAELSVPFLIEWFEEDRVARHTHYSVVASLGLIGPEAKAAVPVLVKLRRRGPHVVDWSLWRIDPERFADPFPALLKSLRDEDEAVRHDAADALRWIHPEPGRMASLLGMFASDDDRVVEALAESMGRVGRPAVVILTHALTHDEERIRAGACQSLGGLARHGAAAVPSLIEALHDGSASVRSAAALALSEFGPTAREAAAPLARLLKDPSADVRANACWSMQYVGAEADVAVTALVEVVDDDDFEVRRAACDSIAHFGPEAMSAIPALVAELGRDLEGWFDSRDGPAALAAIGEAATAALVETLGERDPRLRFRAASTLSRIRIDDRGVSILIESLDHPQLAMSAAEQIGAIGPEAVAAVPDLIGLVEKHYIQLEEPTLTAVDSAIEALGKIGPVAKAAVPLLVRVFEDQDRDWYDHTQAARALGEIGPSARAAVPALIRALKDKPIAKKEFRFGVDELPLGLIVSGRSLDDPTVDVRAEAARALARIGDPAAVPALISALDDDGRFPRTESIDDPNYSHLSKQFYAVRGEAACALGRLGRDVAAEAVPALAAALERSKTRRQMERVATARLCVAGALARLERNPGPAVLEMLIEALEDSDPFLRGMAVTLLGQAGPAARTAAPALERARHDYSLHVRRRAAAALEQIIQ